MSRNAGYLKLFYFQVPNELQRQTTQNLKLAPTFKFPQDPKLKREWLIKMKEGGFLPSKHSLVCVRHFTEDSFEQNLVVRSLLGPSFKLRQLVIKKDVVPTIFNFTMERCKPVFG